MNIFRVPIPVRIVAFMGFALVISSCDRFVTYHLFVKGPDNRALKAQVSEVYTSYVELTDTAGYIELSKITGGIKPDLSKKVMIHKDGYRDTLVDLKPDGETHIQLIKR